MSGRGSPPRLITLIFLTGLSILSLNMFLPSLPNIANDFNVDYGVASLAIGGYLATTAIVQIIIGPLSDRFGRRPVMLVSLGIFVLASIGCLMASDIQSFLAFRMMQAAIISGSALSPAIVKDMYPELEAASLLGYISMAMAVAPILGPMIGGVLDASLGWRASFFVYAIAGLFVLLLCFFDLGETHNKRASDFASQFRQYPLLLGARQFWGYVLCAAFSTGAFYVFLTGVPLVATTHFHLSTGQLGFYLGTITIGFFLGSMMSARFAKFYRATTMMLAGRLIACAGLLAGLALFAFGFDHEYILFGATVFAGIGNGVTMPSCNVGAMSIKPKLAGSAASLIGALTVAAGGMLTSITGKVISAENGVNTLFAMMLFCSIAGLLASWAVRIWEKQDRLPECSPQT